MINLKGEEFAKQVAEVSKDVTEYIFYEKIMTVPGVNTELSYTKALYFAWIKEGLDRGRKN